MKERERREARGDGKRERGVREREREEREGEQHTNICIKADRRTILTVQVEETDRNPLFARVTSHFKPPHQILVPFTFKPTR